MSFKAGFAEIDISPDYFPVRTYMGEVTEIVDPIYAHAAVFSDGKESLAFLSLDIVIIERAYVEKIRAGVEKRTGLPGSCLMLCATHNHACPAVVERGSFKKEERYIEYMIEKSVTTVATAFEKMEDAQIGTGSGFEGRISFNRRFIKRDGTAISQPAISNLSSDILCNEGTIDPEVGVICVKNIAGEVLGIMVNFACHACHLMGQVSAGYPGILYRRLKENFGEGSACLFLNGACGNIIHRNFADPTQKDTKENTGNILAETVSSVIREKIKSFTSPVLKSAETEIPLKYRDISSLEDCVENPEKFVNVFNFLIKNGWYADSLQKLKELKAKSDSEKIIIQVFRIGDAAFAAIPAEYFTELGMAIKQQSPAKLTCVVTLANGWLGYIPTEEALKRQGGHETTTAHWSKMDASTGNTIAAEALKMTNMLW
ncbi:MAG: hypothetical protein A2X49_01715 [Lentisphaerae bacterium GWF2_52_8]|nr:MAG: hypothetical protein A2X49_01715 [Lentisphaerae bacterium GWF2_52_8]